MMAENSRGKRRKQANPKRNQAGLERVSSLGSEGEDGEEVGLWSVEPQDYQGSLDKTSLTPCEGEGEGAEPGRNPSPRGHFTGPHSRRESHWAEGPEEVGPGRITMAEWDGEREQASLMTYGQRSDSQVLEDMAHCEFLVQLRKASSTPRPSHYIPQHHQLPTSSPTPRTVYLPASLSLHSDPPAIWSPVAQRSPGGPDHVSQSPDAMRIPQVCPFCQRSYHRSSSLCEHVKFCPERDGGHMVYTASFREQMEQQMALHNQLHPASEHVMESRKFKCQQCGKAFKYKHHLKEHLRIHSGEKPYECSNCKKRFSHSGSYSSHLSSKKCLTGGGIYNNGHGVHRASNYSPVSPSAGSGRNSSRKGSPYLHHTHDVHPPRRFERERYPGGHPDVGVLRGQELGREFSHFWDPPPAELSPQSSVFKGTTLLPYLHAGGRFEQMLQGMLHKEEGGSIAMREEGGPRVHNGGRDGMTSPETFKRHRVGLDEEREQEEEGGVACRWCSQLFPSPTVLLQHERYLCKMNREAVEVPEGPCSKDHYSPLHSAPRPLLQPLAQADNHKPDFTNGFPKDKSPLQRPSWRSLPQQLLVAMHSSQPRPDTLAVRSYWPSQEGGRGGSPSLPAPISPATEMSSLLPLVRKQVQSSGFGSPLCLDQSSTSLTPPLSQARPQIRTPGSDSSQTDQPLDLSFPKPREVKDLGNRESINGKVPWGEKIQRFPAKNQSHRRLTLSPPPHQQHPPVYNGAPMFGQPIYSAYNLLNSAGLADSRHDGVPTLPLSFPTSNDRFVSPLAFMLEPGTDSVLKRIHMQRHAVMSEMMARGGLDYITLMDGGADIDGGSGRKILKKTDEGLYACDICDKTFQKSSSLLRHKYEHTGKRPHECKTCQKAFKHKHHLIEHSRLHSGEKPYQCDKCGKRFSHSGSYSQHMNHRYAYCSWDQDQGEEHPLTPGGSTDMGHMSGGTPLSMDDTPMFLSDSSLDGGIEGRLDEEGEEEDETKGLNGKEACSLAGSGEGLGLNPYLVVGSPANRDRESRLEKRVGELVDRHEKVRKSAGPGTLVLEHNRNWKREMQKGNGDQDTDPYQPGPESSVSQ